MSSRQEILEEIARITAELRGPMSNLERTLLVANRKELRELLAEAEEKKEKSDG